MLDFIFVVGFLGIFVFLVLGLVSVFRKNKLKAKQNFIYMGVCMLIWIVTSNLMPEVEEVATEPKQEEADKKAEEKADKEAEEKALAEQKAKEEAEAKKKAEEEAKKKAEAEAKKQAEQKAADEADAAINLGFNVAEFEQQWQNGINEVDSQHMSLKDKKAEEGSARDTVQYEVKPQVQVLLIVNKQNGLVREITVATTPSQDAAKNAEILLGMAIAIGASDPSLIPSERGDIFSSLMDQNPSLEEGKVSTVNNGIEYTLSVSSLGLWLFISDVDEE